MVNRLLKPAATSVRTPAGIILISSVLVAHATTAIAALQGWAVVYYVAALTSLYADVLAQSTLAVRTLLGRAQLGYLNRAIIRELSLVILVLRLQTLTPDAFFVFALAVLALPATRFAVLFLRAPLARRRLRPVEVRNIDLPLAEPADAPAWTRLRLQTLVLMSAGVIVLSAPGIAREVWAPFFVAVAAVLLFTVAACAVLVHTLLAKQAALSDADYVQAVGDAVRALRPEVAVYFSGSASSIYQVTMWLPVLEQLERRPVIILRERANLHTLGETTLPVVCLPRATTLMDFRLPTVRVALYVANVGKNLHFLREPRMKHVFIGHGESDKIASINPFTKVYDEIWVAGPISRRRWAAAQVGIRDETIGEVGRPQLAEVLPATGRAPGQPLTVLYAPTWEGWTVNPYASSIATMGPALVRWLLERPTPTRLIYKPHPLTGTVSAAAEAAHREIVALVEAHVGQHAGASTMPVDTTGDPEDVALPTEEVEAYEVWAGAYWARSASHLLVEGPRPTLYDCFNHADLLISDISSVVPDFVASGKPYVVTNPAGEPHEQIRAAYASTTAAYLADPDPATWEPMLELVETVDPMAGRRAQLREDLLGPRLAHPVDRWNHALDDLIRRAREQWPLAEIESAADEHA
jgi:hypothetical protein